jgi:hypothetical protein
MIPYLRQRPAFVMLERMRTLIPAPALCTLSSILFHAVLPLA